MRRLGTSGDWSRSRFTMDEGLSRPVETFVRLHAEGLIYRGKKLVNWDPVLKTAISDLEVVSEEEDGFPWSIAYPLSDGSGQLRGRHHAPGNHAGRYRRDGESEGRALSHLIGKRVRCRCPSARSRSSPMPASSASSAPAWSRSRRRTTSTTTRWPAPRPGGHQHPSPTTQRSTTRRRKIPRPRPLRGAQGGAGRSRGRRPADRNREARCRCRAAIARVR